MLKVEMSMKHIKTTTTNVVTVTTTRLLTSIYLVAMLSYAEIINGWPPPSPLAVPFQVTPSWPLSSTTNHISSPGPILPMALALATVSILDDDSLNDDSRISPTTIRTTITSRTRTKTKTASVSGRKHRTYPKLVHSVGQNQRYHNTHQQSQYPQYPDYNAYHPNQTQFEDNWNSWNRVFKLILLSFVSTIGSMGNIFIVSAITVIDAFQVRGNCFLVSLAFGHLLVTILVLPASAIEIMADVEQEVSESICHFQWLITMACLEVTVLSFLFMSIDNYFGMKSLIAYHNCCTKCRICLLLLLIWTIAFLVPFMQHMFNYGPEFCKQKRLSLNYHPYVGYSAPGFLIICTIITLAYFINSIFMYKNYKKQLESKPEAANFILTDGCLLKSNIIVYLISLAMWLPLLVTMVVDSINPVPKDYMDTVWYIAISNSCSFSYLYAATNRDFREAFNKLFYYCCCKSHVTFSRKGAAIRRTVANESIGLRVHIIPGLNIYAQRKDTTQTSSYRTGTTGGGGGFSGPMGGGGFGGHSSHYGTGGGFGGGFGGKSHKSCEL